MKLQGFVGATYSMDAVSFDCQRLINMYPMVSETGTSKSVSALRSIPGYVEYCTIGGGAIREAKTMSNGRAFAVSGYEFYEVNADQTGTLIDTIGTGTGICKMAENGTEILLVDGNAGYLYNMDTDTFSTIADADFPNGATQVDFVDGYFVVNVPNTPYYAISALYDGTSWDILDRSIASTNPDNLIALKADNGNLWLYGDRSVEVHQNTGAAAFPFERIPGAVIQTGCAAPYTVQSFDNTIAWLGVDDQGRGVVWKANGYSAQRLSTQAIEAYIARSEDFTDSYAYVYHEQGHVFYCLQVRGLSTTLVYDGATGVWHERAFQDEINNTETQHRGAVHFFFDQKNLVGDRQTGKIYQQSLNYYDYDGAEIRRKRVSPHISQEKMNITYSNFELDCEVGRGLVSGQGSDPYIMMRYSDDGGYTWSNERTVSMGKIGQYRTRPRWSRLGSGRDRVFEVTYTEPTFFQINEAFINV